MGHPSSAKQLGAEVLPMFIMPLRIVRSIGSSEVSLIIHAIIVSTSEAVSREICTQTTQSKRTIANVIRRGANSSLLTTVAREGYRGPMHIRYTSTNNFYFGTHVSGARSSCTRHAGSFARW